MRYTISSTNGKRPTLMLECRFWSSIVLIVNPLQFPENSIQYKFIQRHEDVDVMRLRELIGKFDKRKSFASRHSYLIPSHRFINETVRNSSLFSKVVSLWLIVRPFFAYHNSQQNFFICWIRMTKSIINFSSIRIRLQNTFWTVQKIEVISVVISHTTHNFLL